VAEDEGRERGGTCLRGELTAFSQRFLSMRNESNAVCLSPKGEFTALPWSEKRNRRKAVPEPADTDAPLPVFRRKKHNGPDLPLHRNDEG